MESTTGGQGKGLGYLVPHGILLHSHHPLLKRIHIWELRKHWLLHAFSWKPTKTRNILVRQVSRCTDLSLFYTFLCTFTHSCCYFRQNNYLCYDPVSNTKRKGRKEWLPDLFSTLRAVLSHFKKCYTKVRASLAPLLLWACWRSQPAETFQEGFLP